MQSDAEVNNLIVVGSSAGGIEALSTLVAMLPRDLAAPVVIAQHLSPNHPSQLDDILARRTELQVHVVTDRMPLERGVIYIIPPNTQVEIADHHVAVTHERGERPAPLIDLLLTTAAHAYGENLIAVILSGTGNDGASGARDVKTSGGTVIIQNPATAAYPEMPLSLAPTTVDIVADLEGIGPLLHELISGAFLTKPTIQDGQLQTLLGRLREYSGIDFSQYRSGTIERRLQRRVVATGSSNLTDYMRHAQRNPSEYQRLANSFLIKVTEFFRDPDLFTFLQHEAMPQLIEAGRERGELRFWSAGCATGEEAYSLAILVAEALGNDLERMAVRIFATDLDEDAVVFARRGVYPASALVELSPERIAANFTELDGAFEVRKTIRNLVVFGQHDLSQRSPFPRIDLTLCRNVLMYFTPDLQKRALQLFAFSLRDGGLLVLGKAETVNPLPEYFTLQQPRLKVYRRVGDSVLIPPGRIRAISPSVARTPVRPASSGPSAVRARAAREDGTPPATTIRGERLLLGLPEGLLVANQRFQIQFINAVARRLLGIHGAAVGEDLVHVVQYVPVVQLRNAIAAAFRGEESTSIVSTDGLIVDSDTDLQLEIRCYPVRDDSEPSRIELVVAHITDVTTREAERVAALEAQTRLQRVSDAHRSLTVANEELTAANARLGSINDELLVSNEEFQAATEEVETLNEEMQATNEELEALNEELQATVEELNTANDDLQARGVELQELAGSLEKQRHASEIERVRLQAVLANMSDAVALINADGAPVLTNAAFTDQFGEGAERLQPENDDNQPLAPAQSPRRLAAEGREFTLQFSQPDAHGTRRWYEATGQAVPHDGAEALGLLVIRDITDRSLRRMQDEFLALASHELRSPLTTLSGSLQMLRRVLPEDAIDARANRYIAQASQQVNQLAVLINDLVDVVRLQTGKLRIAPRLLDLCSAVTQTVEIARTLTQQHAIEVDAPTEPLFVSADPGRIEQVLLNLLTNAIIYAPGSERIDIRLRRVDGQAEARVRDYGPGISANDLGRIFSRFFQAEQPETRAHSGLGLGLFISREIINAHGGTLDVKSTLGEGATFTVRLPLVELEHPADGARQHG